MSEQNSLNLIAGYSQALAGKRALEQSGSDFYEVRGEVSSMVVQLHPKRLSLVTFNTLPHLDDAAHADWVTYS